MNNLKGKDLDQFFRQELSHHEHPFEESHWLALEHRLRRDKRKRVINFIIAYGLAAMLLIAVTVSLILFNRDNGGNMQAAKRTKKELPASDKAREHTEPLLAGKPTIGGNKEGTVDRSAPRNGFQDNIIPSNLITRVERDGLWERRSGGFLNDSLKKRPAFIAVPQVVTASQLAVNMPSVAEMPKADPASARLSTSKQIKRDFKPSLSLSVFGGPDINGVNNLKNNDGGVSGGISLTYSVLPRLSISAGVAYAKKLYYTDFANYKPNTSYVFPTTPSVVDADCRVLDIPINVSYTAWSRKSNSVQVSAGISSYLMLREEYYFDYNYGSGGPSSYEIKNQNKHFLGVMNMSVGYQKELNKNLTIGIAPYLKLPITDIGYGNVRLESAGINTSINLNLRALKSGKK